MNRAWTGIKVVLWVSVFTLLGVMRVSQGEMNPARSLFLEGFALQKADSLYSVQEYNQALSVYQSVTSKLKIYQQQDTRFRIAYSLYKTEDYDSALVMFYQLAEDGYISSFSRYFYIKILWHLDEKQAASASINYIHKFKKQSLTDSLLLPLADYFYENKVYHKARQYCRQAIKQRVKPAMTKWRVRSGNCLYRTGKKRQALDEYRQIIRKYPSDKNTLELVKRLKEEEYDFFKKHFFEIAEVYSKNYKYTTLRILLENFIKQDFNKKEKARYNLVKIYYHQKRYRTALYGFKTLLSEIQNKDLEPFIRLYIARSYNRLGYKTKSIEAYLDYADRYPRRRIAPETVWKSAWIYEQLKKPREAAKLYRKLRTKWPRSKFAKEAQFREAFTFYRLKDYIEADRIFTDIRFKNWPDIHVNRATYWSALCREVRNDTITAKRLRLELARNMWDDYYTLKSYLMHKEHIDGKWNMLKEFKLSSNPLSFYAAGIANLLPHFEKAFLVRDVLGRKYGLIALSDVKQKASSREEWIALAEIYKKFEDYGKAYKVYDYINKKFYRNRSYVHKSFMLKERFPFYYDSEIEEYSRRYNLEKELVLAIIKQESEYRPDAHSWANAWGLMQLIPSTAKDMARLARVPLASNEQLLQPDLNIHLGSLYLKQLHRSFDGRKEWMLAAYNAGPHRVNRWRKIPGSEQIDVFIENIEFSETRDYVRKVMKNYWAYKLLGSNFQIEDDDILLGFLNTEAKY